MPDFKIEKMIYDRGFSAVCGVDEAGRGPLAGPVCAAAVVLPLECNIEGLNDSKKLTEKQRDKIFECIRQTALSYSIAFASVSEIEEYNILRATYLAMNRAIDGLEMKADFALIDGNRLPDGMKCEGLTVIKGDSLSCSIAAASVLAKVTRDRLMLEYADKYPQYGFDKHKGYGTKQHYQAISEYGICKIHRPSFLKNIYR